MNQLEDLRCDYCTQRYELWMIHSPFYRGYQTICKNCHDMVGPFEHYYTRGVARKNEADKIDDYVFYSIVGLFLGVIVYLLINKFM